jgi:hypothetical protein
MDILLDCVNACFDTVQACSACADACLSEKNIHLLIRCIRLNQDCADIAGVTGKMLVRLNNSDLSILRSQLLACAAACHECASECETHSQDYEYCHDTMEVCRDGEESIKTLLATQMETIP